MPGRANQHPTVASLDQLFFSSSSCPSFIQQKSWKSSVPLTTQSLNQHNALSTIPKRRPRRLLQKRQNALWILQHISISFLNPNRSQPRIIQLISALWIIPPTSISYPRPKRVVILTPLTPATICQLSHSNRLFPVKNSN